MGCIMTFSYIYTLYFIPIHLHCPSLSLCLSCWAFPSPQLGTMMSLSCLFYKDEPLSFVNVAYRDMAAKALSQENMHLPSATSLKTTSTPLPETMDLLAFQLWFAAGPCGTQHWWGTLGTSRDMPTFRKLLACPLGHSEHAPKVSDWGSCPSFWAEFPAV